MKKENEKSTRRTMWHIKTTTPINSSVFRVIEAGIKSLISDDDNFYIVELLNFSKGNVAFVQTALCEAGIWVVELNFKTKYEVRYMVNGEERIKKYPYTMYRYRTDNQKEVLDIFKTMLVENKLPDMEKWKDCTDEIAKPVELVVIG